MQALLLPVGTDRYAVPVSDVREVLVAPRITALPTAPACFRSLINVRGEVVPLLDTAKLLGIGMLIDVPYAVLVDGEGRPQGWLSEVALGGARVPAQPRSRLAFTVELDDVLRDALSDLLAHEAQYGAVLDAAGRVAGVLSIELLSQALAAPPEDVSRPVELAEP